MATAALAAVQGISPTSSIRPRRAFLTNNCSHITCLNLQHGYSSAGAQHNRSKRESNRGPVIGFQKKRHYSSIYRIRAADEPMKPPYNVLITGSSKGIGYALAKEFLRAGDNVIICSRSDDNVQAAIKNVKNEFGDQHLWGTTCDVRDGESVRVLVDFARNTIGYVDIWLLGWRRRVLVHLLSVWHRFIAICSRLRADSKLFPSKSGFTTGLDDIQEEGGESEDTDSEHSDSEDEEDEESLPGPTPRPPPPQTTATARAARPSPSPIVFTRTTGKGKGKRKM